MTYVFQYGSNTLPSRFNSEDRLRGDARSLGAVYTEDEFELDFDVWSVSNQCAAADIIPKILLKMIFSTDSLIDKIR